MPDGRWIFITEETRDALDALPYSDLLYGLVEAYDAMPEQHVRDFPAKPGFNRRHIDIVITFPDSPSEHTPENTCLRTGTHISDCEEAETCSHCKSDRMNVTREGVTMGKDIDDLGPGLDVRAVWLSAADAERFGLSSAWKRATKDPAGEVLDVVTKAFGDQALGRRNGTTVAILKALGYYV